MAPIDAQAFLHALSGRKLTVTERAVALLWWHGLSDPGTARTPRELAQEIEAAGYPALNISRLGKSLGKDRRTAKAAGNGFRIRITARAGLDDSYKEVVGSRPIPESDSVLPQDLFGGTRGYLEKVVRQINASFDAALYDCCAVMCRRLLETLLIDVFEAKQISENLKDGEGHYPMFSGLLAATEKQKAFSLGRNATSALIDFKKLGDLSAHTRRFNARRTDILPIRNGLRIASEELLHLAGYI